MNNTNNFGDEEGAHKQALKVKQLGAQKVEYEDDMGLLDMHDTTPTKKSLALGYCCLYFLVCLVVWL